MTYTQIDCNSLGGKMKGVSYMKVYIIVTKNFSYVDVKDTKAKADKLVKELLEELASVGVTEEEYRVIEKVLE